MISVSNIFAGFSAKTLTFPPSGAANYVAAPKELKADDLQELKGEISKYDLAAVSQKELFGLASKLYQNNLINESVLGRLTLANADFDGKGNQQNTDKPFNALEYFDMQLGASSEGLAGGEAAYRSGNEVLKQVNQVLAVLRAFADSPESNVGLRVKA